MSDHFTTVRRARNDGEAQQLLRFFAAHQIPAELHGDVGARLLGGVGGIVVAVPDELAEPARALLAQVEAGELELPAEPDVAPEAG